MNCFYYESKFKIKKTYFFVLVVGGGGEWGWGREGP